MDESKSTIYHRLADTGLWEAASRRREEIRSELRATGMSRKEANERSWQLIAEEYPPPTPPAPALVPEPLLPGEHYPDGDGNYLQVLDWVCCALGRADEGRKVRRLDAPGPKAWAVYAWASTDIRNRKEFFSLWTAAHRRESTGEDESAVAEVRRQTAELEAMLAELHGVPVDSSGQSTVPP